jgi:hypothetical protein
LNNVLILPLIHGEPVSTATDPLAAPQIAPAAQILVATATSADVAGGSPSVARQTLADQKSLHHRHA